MASINGESAQWILLSHKLS
ncbi:uncharacterized protein G2W53_019450 [Senna tora]|uniref:Uncharacterized protein n=1 Tax=Senna tora TaxID=362788 RepID=A0A834TWZ7_9FABA|nr:uncharacterized protein G2W53_019450 [Senna tora]